MDHVAFVSRFICLVFLSIYIYDDVSNQVEEL